MSRIYKTKPTGRPPKPEPERFWPKVNKDGPIPDPVRYPNLKTRCWQWMASVNWCGYGQFGRRSLGAHRWSWRHQNGEIPDGLSVLHSCDNRRCVNPDHLFLGEQATNVQDCVLKGRHTKGCMQGSAKLNDLRVRVIRRLLQFGMNYTDAGGVFKVDKSTIGLISRRKIWTHV